MFWVFLCCREPTTHLFRILYTSPMLYFRYPCSDSIMDNHDHDHDHNPSQADTNMGDHGAHPDNTDSEREMTTDILLSPEKFDQPLYVDPRKMEYDPQFSGKFPEDNDGWTAEEGGASPSNSSTSQPEATPPAGEPSAGEGPSTHRPTNYRFYNDIPSAEDWEAVKMLLGEMYIKKGMKLQEVARVMEKDHQFCAT